MFGVYKAESYCCFESPRTPVVLFSYWSKYTHKNLTRSQIWEVIFSLYVDRLDLDPTQDSCRIHIHPIEDGSASGHLMVLAPIWIVCIGKAECYYCSYYKLVGQVLMQILSDTNGPLQGLLGRACRETTYGGGIIWSRTIKSISNRMSLYLLVGIYNMHWMAGYDTSD